MSLSIARARCSLHIPSLSSNFIARRAMMSALRNGPNPHQVPALPDSPPVTIPAERMLSPDAAAPQTAAPPPPVPKAEKPRPKIRSTKAALTIVLYFSISHLHLLICASFLQTPGAVARLRNLLTGPTPQLIRIGVRNKGCAGLSYHLDYVDKPGKFDEVVTQDGVRVLIDSKALFSIIGSEMDWKEDQLRCVATSCTRPTHHTDTFLSSKFVFANPNIKDACGCGESFNVAS